jgi:hypothetical protein
MVTRFENQVIFAIAHQASIVFLRTTIDQTALRGKKPGARPKTSENMPQAAEGASKIVKFFTN